MGKDTVINCDLSPRRNLRILVVDDEKDIGLVLKRELEDHGFEADAYHEPESALMNFSAGSYDLVITDIKMPKMNGFELFREIRKIDSRVKVCFLTAFEIYREEFKKMFPSTEVNHFIKKPISICDLLKIIESEVIEGS